MKLIISNRKINLVNTLKKLTKVNNFIIFYNSNNKPLSNKFYFNKSTKDNITVIVCSDKEIGVDIEKISTMPHNIFYTEEENNLSNIDKIILWTKKEAYIKKLGLSMKDIKKIKLDGKFKTIKYKDYYITISM